MKWEAGARAAIVISEHYENHNRVVTLIEVIGRTELAVIWMVRDGKQLKGYDHSKLPDRVFMWSDELGIEQWKLRLLDDGEPVVIRDGVEYVEA
jgi:hypothetical protein